MLQRGTLNTNSLKHTQRCCCRTKRKKNPNICSFPQLKLHRMTSEVQEWTRCLALGCEWHMQHNNTKRCDFFERHGRMQSSHVKTFHICCFKKEQHFWMLTSQTCSFPAVRTKSQKYISVSGCLWGEAMRQTEVSLNQRKSFVGLVVYLHGIRCRIMKT